MSIRFPESIAAERNEILHYLGSAWEPYTTDLDLLLHLRWLGFQPRCIYDIGASNTVWSVMAFAVFPQARFELFEPLSNISDAYLNGKFTHPVICDFIRKADHRIHPIALGDREGKCRFQHFDSDAGSTSLELRPNQPSARVIKVPMHRLDTYAAKKNLPPPDLIKLDTQGSELGILQGGQASLRHAGAVFIECWLTKGYGRHTPLFLTIANLLAASGFDLFALGDEYRDADGVAQTKDAVFVQRTLPLNPSISVD